MFKHKTASFLNEVMPLTIYVQHQDKRRNGTWRPEAWIAFSRGLHTSGFLATIPAEELKTLLGLLSFVTPNGFIAPNLAQLAQAFHLPSDKMKRRLERLLTTTWRDKPLIVQRNAGGLTTYSPQVDFLPVVEEKQDDYLPGVSMRYVAGARETVVANSRRYYARPRAEVEAVIEQQLSRGQPAVPSEETTHLRVRLENTGLTSEQARSLLERFDAERIRRQLAWLPYRHARNPAGLLLTAIEHDYEAPLALREVLPQRDPLPQSQELEALQGSENLADTESETSNVDTPQEQGLSPAPVTPDTTPIADFCDTGSGFGYAGSRNVDETVTLSLPAQQGEKVQESAV